MGETSDGRYRSRGEARGGSGPTWEATSVRALRLHLGLSQRSLAEELGIRQQTVSEWETGLYRPRGASSRLLTIVAERAGFAYETRGTGPEEAGKGNRERERGEGE